MYFQLFTRITKFNSFRRTISTKTLSPSLTFISNGSTRDLESGRVDLSKYSNEGRPLTIVMCWLMAKNQAVNKYVQVYLDRGYDVLTVRVTPWQVLLPANIGVDLVIENEILPALLSSNHENKLIHGFSVGSFVQGRMLKRMENDSSCENYKKSVKGQIWDSAGDIKGLSLGLSTSIFRENPKLQEGVRNYVDWHMKYFYNISTQYYQEARDYFIHKPLKVPALFLISEVDPISPVDFFEETKNAWVDKGIQFRSKIWKDSDHVGHMKKYPIEYQETVDGFLNTIGLRVRTNILSEPVLSTENVRNLSHANI